MEDVEEKSYIGGVEERKREKTKSKEEKENGFYEVADVWDP